MLNNQPPPPSSPFPKISKSFTRNQNQEANSFLHKCFSLLDRNRNFICKCLFAKGPQFDVHKTHYECFECEARGRLAQFFIEAHPISCNYG